MALNRQQLEEGTTNNCGSEPNTSLTDELAGVTALTRRAGELVVIQTLQRYAGPILEPVLERLVRRVVKEEIGLAQLKQLTSMKEGPANKASTSVLKQLKLRFRNKISQPAFTGKDLLGENQKPIEIVLVDALTEQIVNIGTESTAKLEIVVLQVGDDDSWTFEEFQKSIVSEKNGKRILQGNTYLHLKEGVGLVGKVSFTQSSEWTKNVWYRLGARVVDAGLMAGVEAAITEAFLIKDWRTTLYEKHYPPSLLDKVYHLEQISSKGAYYKRLKDAKVETVKDFLTLLHTDRKRLEDILKLKASSRIWVDIVNHAETSDGMFLYLDASYEGKTGVVLNVKLQLKGLIGESHEYIPFAQLSDKQKVDTQNLVRIASENLEVLHSFKDEASLKEFLQSGIAFGSLPSANLSLGTSKIIDGSPSLPSQVTYSSLGPFQAPDNLDDSNLHKGQGPNQAPMVTSQSERGKETVPFDKEMTYSMNYYQQNISFHSINPFDLESPNEFNFGTPADRHAHNPTQPGTCGHMNNFDNVFNQSADWPIYAPDSNFEEYLHNCLNYDSNSPDNGRHSEPANSDTEVVIMAAHTVSVCTSAQTRWTKVSKLLRRLSVRERIGLPEGIQAQKKQRCC